MRKHIQNETYHFIPKNDNRFSNEFFITKYLVFRDKTYFKKNISSGIYSQKPKLDFRNFQ